uniref:RNA-directed DNA polymerase (Reverse transcriptase) n=1 Tax=Medicago truncatula TaxID=3880 RepID=A2Q5E1_MEDTR|nr:RNA-directed DNA polymerase (Reverse transcriptase) [Medicago truncatula]
MLRHRLGKLLIRDDVFWKQRAKTFWYRDGDLNTKFFHAAATIRRKLNRIEHLEDGNGFECRSEDGLKHIARDYFIQLFQKSNGSRVNVINLVPTTITKEDNAMLTTPFTVEGFKHATFSMQADKCPGPDGFNPGFYQHFWSTYGHEAYQAGCQWLASGAFPPHVNSTNITLIPKGDSHTSMKDWRPIALCNVVYKIVAKSAFVPERSILDNAMVAIEIVHYMKAKAKGKSEDVALKLDISKAYDRLDWDYLRDIMTQMGFSSRWVSWIMLCVETVDYSVLVNGASVGPIVPGRDLRQGDPLSPYLFIICVEGLSSLLREAERCNDIRACEREAFCMKNILATYEEALGQAINLQKSKLFCTRNTPEDLKSLIAATIGVHQVLGTGKYLGLPSMIGRSKHATFKFIKDRIRNKINSWSSRCLSQAGREVLIKSVLKSIHSYVMSVFLLQGSLINEIEKMLNSF